MKNERKTLLESASNMTDDGKKITGDLPAKEKGINQKTEKGKHNEDFDQPHTVSPSQIFSHYTHGFRVFQDVFCIRIRRKKLLRIGNLDKIIFNN